MVPVSQIYFHIYTSFFISKIHICGNLSFKFFSFLHLLRPRLLRPPACFLGSRRRSSQLGGRGHGGADGRGGRVCGRVHEEIPIRQRFPRRHQGTSLTPTHTLVAHDLPPGSGKNSPSLSFYMHTHTHIHTVGINTKQLFNFDL